MFSCRLNKIQVEEALCRRFLIKNRVRSLSLSAFRQVDLDQIFSYQLSELQETYPNINFSHPLAVEVGCGTGDFLIHAASRHPEINFIGIDIALPCIQRAIQKLAHTKMDNILFYNGLVNDFLSYDFRRFQFSKIMVNFPDPWPKKRHLKRRIVSLTFLERCYYCLEPGGSVYTATDVEPLFRYHLETFDRVKGFYRSPVSSFHHPPDQLYQYASSYQLKNLSGSKKVFYTHYLKSESFLDA